MKQTPWFNSAPARFSYLFLFFLFSQNLQAQFVTNGSASSSGAGCYALTQNAGNQAGSILSSSTVNLSEPFQESATLNFGTNDGNGADGIVFIFATSNGVLGGTGENIGYGGIIPSVTIEMDTWQNPGQGDPAEDHIAITSGGSVSHTAPTHLAGPATLPNIEDGNDHCFSVSWDPASQTLTGMLDGSIVTYVGDITGILGSSVVYWGFTASTGGATNLQTVCVGGPNLVPMDDLETCPGQGVTLMPDPNGQSYAWTSHPTLSNPNVQNPIATPTITTTYNVVISYACGGTASDDVTVVVTPPPPATAGSNSPICEGDQINLAADGGISYEWSGPGGFFSSLQSPGISNASSFDAGTYTVTVTDANGCTATASTVVVVNLPPQVSILPPGFLCENEPPVTLFALPPGGIWGGVANGQGQVDPGALGEGLHLVTYEYTDPNGCTEEAAILIEVAALPVVVIEPAGPFCASDAPQTLTASPPGGTWSGAANAAGQVDPALLGVGTHLVTYSYAAANGCSDFDEFFVEILITPVVAILPAGPFCLSSGVQTLTGNPSGGVWGGAANTAGQINPAGLGAGTHQVTYAYGNANGCWNDAVADIQIWQSPTAQISGGGTVCQGSGQKTDVCFQLSGAAPFTVNWAIDNVAQPPLTLSSNSTCLQVDQPGTYTILQVTDNHGCTAAGTGSAVVVAVGAPVVAGLDFTCNAANSEYVVTFNLSGGDPASYSVGGSSGNLSPAPPYVFTSNPIADGMGYNFTVNDANNCSPTILSGTFSCGCSTQAGTMSMNQVAVCQGQTATAQHNGNQFLDGNDALIFVLHDGNGNALGNVFATNSTPSFNFSPPMQTGVSYYISAVAGNSNGSDGVILSDICLSVSLGTPVVFNALPNGSLASTPEICAGESAMLTFSLSGNAPFDVTYSNGSQNFSLNNILNGHSVSLSPAQTTTYNLVSVGDNSNPTCSISGNSTSTVTVWQAAASTANVSICEGDSIFLQKAWQSAAGTYFDTLATSHGCDSVIATSLNIKFPDTSYLTAQTCDPALVGLSSQTFTNVNGCDSTVFTTTTLILPDTTLLTATTCDPAMAGIFTQTLTAAATGCDSVVITTVTELPKDTTYRFDSSCNPASVGVFSQILTNQFGCDSLVVTTITFSETDTTLLASETCDQFSAGVFTQNLVTPEGCDSIVIETVSLLPKDTTLHFGSSCNPASVGVFSQTFTNQFGCDSLVVTTITFSETDTTLLAWATCDPALAGVFTQNLVTPEGCDSTVITTVSLLPKDTTYLTDTSCDPAAAGIFSLLLTNQQGCDSLIIKTVALLSGDTTYLSFTTCDPAAAGTTSELLTTWQGCDSLVISTTALLPPAECGVQATLEGSEIPCGETTGTLTLTPVFGEHPFNFEVKKDGIMVATGSVGEVGMSVLLDGLAAGEYEVTVTSGTGFSTIVQATITQLFFPEISVEATSDFVGFNISCNGGTDGSASSSATSGQPPYQFSWSNGSTLPAVNNLPAGVFQVTVTDANGCEDTASIILIEPDSLRMTFSVSDIDCFGQSEGAIFVEAEGGVLPVRYSLNGGEFQEQAAFFNLTEGSYELTAQDANGCETTELLLVNAPYPVDVELGENLVLKLGDQTDLQATVNVPFDSLAAIIWTNLDSAECPNCLSQPIAPLITSSYAIQVTGNNGCPDSDDLTVFVDRRKSVFVPNAFSPNEDGINDWLQVFSNPKIVLKIKRFLVFSRWGETVFQYYNFQPNDPAYGWDGKHRGEEMDPAVFTWFAEVEFVDGEVRLYEGDVTLMR